MVERLHGSLYHLLYCSRLWFGVTQGVRRGGTPSLSDY